MNEANKEKEEDVAETAPMVRCTLATPSLPPAIIEEMEEMTLRLGFNQTVGTKLVDYQGIDSPWTQASLSDEVIAIICKMTCRPGRLVSRKTPDRGNQFFPG